MPIKEIAHAYRPTRHANARARARPHSAPRGPLRSGSAEPGRAVELPLRLGVIPSGQRRRLGDGDRQLSAHDRRSPLDRRGRPRRDHHRLERDPTRVPKRLRVPGARRPHEAGSARDVSREVIGHEDLDDYGDWRETGPYGAVWVPRSMIVGWAPYRYGHWAWVDPWGWTWIDDAPWGFAPFHYGRWVYVDG